LEVQPLSLVPVVQSAIDAVRPAADAKQIRLETVIDPEAGPVHGDPARFQQVVWNLLMNSIKFTPAGGRVWLRLARYGADVQVTVRDTGIGIAREVLRTWKPAVLVADIAMPDEDGYTLLRKVRALGREEGRDVPVLALTAHARPEDRERALAAGFQAYLAKPVDPPTLLEAIAELA